MLSMFATRFYGSTLEEGHDLLGTSVVTQLFVAGNRKQETVFPATSVALAKNWASVASVVDAHTGGKPHVLLFDSCLPRTVGCQFREKRDLPDLGKLQLTAASIFDAGPHKRQMFTNHEEILHQRRLGYSTRASNKGL